MNAASDLIAFTVLSQLLNSISDCRLLRGVLCAQKWIHPKARRVPMALQNRLCAEEQPSVTAPHNTCVHYLTGGWSWEKVDFTTCD